jgi:hypothetical protein
MKAKWALMAGAAILAAMPALAQSQLAAQASVSGKISGDYMEFRNADVYTGPCFANSEVGLSGQNAVLAWHVADGEWGGVPLDGLSVAAVVRANATLGDPYSDPLPAKTVFFVDERATEAQRAALVNFAQSQAGGLLNDVVAIAPAPISFAADTGRVGFETLAVGSIVKLSTRALVMTDMICHNEEVYYQPLAGHLAHAMPVVESESSYQGGSLGVTWTEAGRRSSFVGKFSE